MNISDLKVDSKAIAAGQWVSEIPDLGDVRLRVRGMSSPEVAALLSKKQRAVPKKERDRDGQPKMEASIRILSEVLHEAVLLDWEGITDGGKKVPYSSARAKEWLTNPDFRQFADGVAFAARAVDRGHFEKVDDAAGN